jgi:uncharacterized protein HemX
VATEGSGISDRGMEAFRVAGSWLLLVVLLAGGLLWLMRRQAAGEQIRELRQRCESARRRCGALRQRVRTIQEEIRRRHPPA